MQEDVSNPEVWNRGFLILSTLLLAAGYVVYKGAGWESSHPAPPTQAAGIAQAPRRGGWENRGG